MEDGVSLPCRCFLKPFLLSMGAPRCGSVAHLRDVLSTMGPPLLRSRLNKSVPMRATGLSEFLLG